MINAHHYFIHKINILFPRKTPILIIELIIQSLDSWNFGNTYAIFKIMSTFNLCRFKSTSIIVYTNSNQHYFYRGP